MELIHNNPYRVAGILSNATAKELQKKKARVKAYAKVGRAIESEYDFGFLKNIERTEELVDRAFSNIEQNNDKVNHALFWFINASQVDQIAIDYLKNEDPKTAIEKWEQVCKNKSINSNNYSAYSNLGTYKLLSQDKYAIREGIAAKIKLLESDYFRDFAHTVSDKTFTVDNVAQIQKFIDALLKHYKNKYSSTETLELFENCNGEAQKYLSKKFTEDHIHRIEHQIESTKGKRKANKSDAYQLGVNLFTNSKNDLSFLKSLLGSNDLKYKTVADNLAKEVMQCGIDYFKEWKDIKDVSEEGLKLLKYAQSIAARTQTKDRVKENIDGIKEWARTAPIKAEFEFIMKKLIAFRNKADSIANADDLVSSCSPKLQSIRNILGSSNEEYLNLSTAVGNNAVGMLITVVNIEQESLSVQLGDLSSLKATLKGALSVSKKIDALDMKAEQKRHFQTNYSTLKSIASQIGGSSSPRPSSSTSTRTTSSSSSDNEGCAPWVYVVGVIVLLIFLANACS